MAELGDWFRQMPQFTKWWFSMSLALPLLGRFGLINPYLLVLYYTDVVHKFQIWRPITAVFYYPINQQTGFHYMLNLYFLYNYSHRLETGRFDRRPADYLFMLLFNWLTLVSLGLFCNVMLLMDPMVLSVLYIWCQLNKDTVVSFWFGTRFKALYLPWVLLGLNCLMGGGILYNLLGILAGHLYYFLAIRYPEENRTTPLIRTPAILEHYYPPRLHPPPGAFGGFAGAGPNNPRPPPNGPHTWGHGHVLGGQ